jgi:DNA-binding NtrC family response regulator
MEKRPTLKVLLIEDDEDDYTLLKNMLAQISPTSFHLEWVNTYQAGVQGICSATHDVYLVDYRLGQRDGLELLREVTARGCEMPIILLTGQGGYDVDIEAMEAGAADYLVKGQITADLLERSIRYSIAQTDRSRELRKYRDYLEQLVRERTRELEQTLANVKVLRGLLPICAWCKKIRDDKGYWQQIEAYIHDHTEADFSHSICPECAQKVRKEIGLPPQT